MHKKLGAWFGLLIFSVLVLAPILSFIQPASAKAADFYTRFPWTDSRGQGHDITSTDEFGSGRFVFYDTTTIHDNSTNTNYKLEGTQNPVLNTYDTSANQTGDGSGLGGSCDSDKGDIYNDSICSKPNHYYWLWPEGVNPTQPDGNKVCRGGIVMTALRMKTATSTTTASGIYINYVPTYFNAQANACHTYNNTAKTRGDGDVHTGMEDLSSLGSVKDDINDGTLPTFGTNNNAVQFSKVASPGKTLAQLRGFTTFLTWDKSALQIVASGGTLTKLDNTGGNWGGMYITAHLEKGSGTAQYASGYDYYSTAQCLSNPGGKDEKSFAFLAVKQGATPGNGPAVGYLLHDNSPRGDSGTGDAHADWFGTNFNCLFGTTKIGDNPLEIFFGDAAHSISGWQGNNTVLLGNPGNFDPSAQPATPITPPGGAGDKTNPLSIGCGGGGLFSLNWLVCPIIDGLQDAANALDDGIAKELTVPTDKYFSDSQSGSSTDSSKTANVMWQSLRNISLSLLVIIALIMVISQAIEVGPFDAYAVRKTLPRIIIAVIAIALSWPLAKFFVQFSNDAGIGVKTLIESIAGTSGQIKIGGGAAAITGIIGGSFAIALGALGLLSFVGTAVLALLIGLFIIVLRRLIIVVCVITAPLAIVCWILPGTQKVWKIWKDSFVGAALAFPLITGTIALGAVLASIESSTDPDHKSLVAQAAIMVLYFGPYFLLPAILKSAGGVLSTVTGHLNDRGRGAFDRLKKFRQEQPGKRLQKAKAGELYSGSRYIPGSRRLATRMNTITKGAGMGPRGGFGLGGRGKEAFDQTNSALADEKMKTPQFSAIKDKEEALRALTYESEAAARRGLMARHVASNLSKGMSQAEAEAAARTTTDAAINSANSSGFRFGDRSIAVAAARQLVNTGTGYEDLEDMTETLTRASGGNVSTAAGLAGYANSAAKQTGRYDLSPSYGELNKLVQSGISGGGPSTQAFETATVKAARGVDPVTLLRGKPKQVENLTNGLQSALNDSLAVMQNPAATTQQKAEASMEAKQLIGQINQLDTNKSYASQENQMLVNSLVASADAAKQSVVQILSAQPNAQEHMDDIQRFSAPPQYANNPNNPQPSDSRLKRNVHYLYTQKNINVYSFQYLWSDQIYIGVMAQEILEDYPDAVSIAQNGFYQVNYSLLGMRMLTLEEWEKEQPIAVE